MDLKGTLRRLLVTKPGPKSSVCWLMYLLKKLFAVSAILAFLSHRQAIRGEGWITALRFMTLGIEISEEFCRKIILKLVRGIQVKTIISAV